MTTTREDDARRAALDQAVRQGSDLESPAMTVARAEAFLAFLTDTDQKEQHA